MSALTPRQMFLLDLACQPIRDAFNDTPYHVGTSAMRSSYRDVDVRLMLGDKKHDKLRKAIGLDGIAFLGLAIGQYLAGFTGLPIDFQIQRQTEANILHRGSRNPLGLRSLSAFRGDAQKADAERVLQSAESTEESSDA